MHTSNALLLTRQLVLQVIPSHGEGWGRPHMEAMACGTPVVATNWSGPTAFISEQNGFPLSIEARLVDAP